MIRRRMICLWILCIAVPMAVHAATFEDSQSIPGWRIRITIDLSPQDTPPPSIPTLRIQGNDLLDTCGTPLIVRGVEQIFGHGIGVGGSWTALVDEIAKTGANAIRVLPDISQLSAADVDQILGRITSHSLVGFLSPGERTWFNRPDVQTVLAKYLPWLIIDAYQEGEFDDAVRWQQEAIAAVNTIRSYGYTVPVTVMANQYGRDLPSLLSRGKAIIAADPQLIFGWQAYWGRSNWYQGYYGISLTEGILRAAEQAFPIQLGITSQADPGDLMDYAAAMTAAQNIGLGWLWWNWYNPFGPSVFNLTSNGTMGALTSHGRAVVPNLKPAVKACTP